jgi:hypothetical protein
VPTSGRLRRGGRAQGLASLSRRERFERGLVRGGSSSRTAGAGSAAGRRASRWPGGQRGVGRRAAPSSGGSGDAAVMAVHGKNRVRGRGSQVSRPPAEGASVSREAAAPCGDLRVIPDGFRSDGPRGASREAETVNPHSIRAPRPALRPPFPPADFRREAPPLARRGPHAYLDRFSTGARA